MKTHINKSAIISGSFICVIFFVLFACLLIDYELSGDHNYVEWCCGFFFLIGWIFIIKSSTRSFITVKFSENQISSHLFFKKRCTVFGNCPIYVSFFKEFLYSVDKFKAHDYVMVSNLPIPDFAPDTHFKTFDMSTQIIFPDTEKTREAIAPLLTSEFCILQGDAPPPIEELRKKKERKKEEPPVAKRQKSPDDPPPFTGKWNGRF